MRLILGALVFVLFVGCGGGGQQVSGLLELYGDESSVENNGTECWGVGGYGDIQEGAEVTIRDGSGELIGSGNLDAGSTVGDGTCTFLWFIDDVSEVDFYEIEVSSRGALTYSKAEMEEANWIVQGSIGD